MAHASVQHDRLRAPLMTTIFYVSLACLHVDIPIMVSFSVVVWSGLNVSGVRLVDLNPKIGTEEDPERWVDVHKQVINGFVDRIFLSSDTCF